MPDDYDDGMGGVALLNIPKGDEFPQPLLLPAILMCFIFTFWLVYVVLHTAADGTDVNFVALGVGLYITVAVYAL